MLAYVFWHWPAVAEEGRYEEALVAFHRSLAASRPDGMRGSRAFAVEAAPWLPVARAYEDWYFLDDFAALGTLNEAAVSGARRAPHDGAARLAGGGAGGVYRRISSPVGRPVDRITWLAKPAGMSYAELLARLPAVEVWQRQLVLGPAPEFCLVGSDPPAGLEGRAVPVRTVYRSP